MTSEPMPLKAVVFDWAGTILDHGSLAPMGVFVRVFAEFGVDVTVAEARIPMGLPKWDHIKAVGSLPRVAAAWRQAHGAAFTDRDVDRLYDIFVPLNVEVVADYAGFVPGALETVAELRRRGLKIGSTTGYSREIMERLAPIAAEAGYRPDNLVCAGDLAHGRPAPMMMYQTFLDLDVWPAAACVKVDDTEPGLAEGRAAGCWTVAVSVSGNAFGLSREEAAALDPAEFAARKDVAENTLRRAEPDYIIEGVGDLLPVIDAIEARLAKGERPA